MKPRHNRQHLKLLIVGAEQKLCCWCLSRSKMCQIFHRASWSGEVSNTWWHDGARVWLSRRCSVWVVKWQLQDRQTWLHDRNWRADQVDRKTPRTSESVNSCTTIRLRSSSAI